MKLLRYGPPGLERPGLLDHEGQMRDLSGHVSDIDSLSITPEGLDFLRGIDPASLPVVNSRPRVGAPVGNVRNILCIGLNYHDHARELGLPIPAEPILFSKHTGALSGPFDPIPLPEGSARTDWEAELAVVIGAPAYNLAAEDAPRVIAGYTICHDVSERAFQMDHGGQWIKGKSCPGFCPLGPLLVTADEVPDPQALRLWLEVNGETMQDGSTADMIFPVHFLVAYVSRFMALQPGDVIATGTPAGVGQGRGVFLKSGDRVRLGIDGLGEQMQEVV